MPLSDHEATLNSLPATFTPADVTRLGTSRRAVYNWLDAGIVMELSRGVYRKSDAPETAHLDVIALARRVPRAIVCLVSALVVHELTDEIPPAVQLAVPRGTHLPHVKYPPAEFSRFDPATFELGREEFEAAQGEFVPVYSPERTIADCMRLRHRVGDTVAIHSLRAYLSKNQSGAPDLVAIARQLGDESTMVRTIQVLSS